METLLVLNETSSYWMELMPIKFHWTKKILHMKIMILSQLEKM